MGCTPDSSSQSFLFQFRFFWVLCGFVVALRSAGCKPTDGTTEEQRHREF
ncbi:hypothetical protein ASZ90_011720 [hydrocarbon metagenome]|uniref:Uncharacterized protein n=1 Tax=hydrocarbon metagenome TaxID=938273 RepID=A0A0W8FCW8_9ZZZZ